MVYMHLIDPLIQRASFYYTSTASPYMWAVFLALKKVHAGWRWYRRFHLYTQPQSSGQLLAGTFVNATLANIPFVPQLTRTVQIATRLLEASQQLVNTSRAFQMWFKVIKGEYCSTDKIKWEAGDPPFLSPSTAYWFALKKAKLSERVEKIALATWGVGSAFTTLCMKVMDIYDAIYPEDDSRFDATQEVFVNVSKWLDAAVENRQAMLKAFDNNKPVFNYILGGTGIEFSQVSQGAKTALDAIQKGQKYYNISFGRGQYNLKYVPVMIN